MPIKIVPTKRGMQDIDRSTFKASGYDVDAELAKNKKNRKESIAELRDKIASIEEMLDEQEVDETAEIEEEQVEEVEQPVAEEEFAEEDDLEMAEEQEVAEEEVEETVEVPVAELNAIMRLAGFDGYQPVEEYANEPDEEYMDAEEQLIGLSGGLNGPKKMHPPASLGDNPMDQEPREVAETDDPIKTLEAELYKSYESFLEDQEDVKD